MLDKFISQIFELQNPTKTNLNTGAGILHLIEPIWALYIAGTYGLNLTTSVLWAFSGLIFGIFGLWPLVFPEFFFSVKDQYCQYSPKSTALYSPCSVKLSSQKYKKTFWTLDQTNKITIKQPEP